MRALQMDIDDVPATGTPFAASMLASTPAEAAPAAEDGSSGNDDMDMDISMLAASMSELRIPKTLSFGRRGRNGSSRLATSGDVNSNPYLQ